VFVEARTSGPEDTGSEAEGQRRQRPNRPGPKPKPIDPKNKTLS